MIPLFFFRNKNLVCGAVWLFAMISPRLQAEPAVSIEAEVRSPGAVLPGDFNGLSFEMQRVLADTNGSHYFSATNHGLVSTFKVLGIKNLRVGGNTADRPSLPTPSESDVDNLFAFAKAAGVKVIFTLRLNQGSSGAAAKMAGYIQRRYSNQLDCFSIGNEPNVFSTNFETYFAEWKRFAAQITAPSNAPSARFCGPGVSPGHEKWSAQFASNGVGSGLIKFVSQHDYTGGDARRVTNAAAARDKILSAGMDGHYEKFAANFVPAVLSNGLGFRFEEANSFYDGGAPDVSDTFASALWALNFQWWWAGHGMIGINFHTGDKVAARDENKPCRYASFWTVPGGNNIHPIGYAEKMFSFGGQGRLLKIKTLGVSETNLNFAGYASVDAGNILFFTLINKSHGPGATNLSVRLSADGISGWRRSEIIRLATPDGDVSRKTGVTLGGAEISDAGKWHGRWQTIPLSSKDAPSTITVDLPAASAAVVKLTPR